MGSYSHGIPLFGKAIKAPTFSKRGSRAAETAGGRMRIQSAPGKFWKRHSALLHELHTLYVCPVSLAATLS